MTEIVSYRSEYLRLEEENQNASRPFTHDITLFGASHSGKTTFLYALKYQEILQVTPTAGFNRELVEVGGNRFEIIDLSGNLRYHPSWEIFAGAKMFIVFVTTHCEELIRESELVIQRIVNIHPKKPVLVLSSKTDLIGSLTLEQVFERFNLAAAFADRSWRIMECSWGNYMNPQSIFRVMKTLREMDKEEMIR